MVSREQRQELHREYAEAVKDLPFLEQMGFRHWAEEKLIGARAMIGLLDDQIKFKDGEIKGLRESLAAARRAGEREA